jgi:beta-glucosidase
VSEEVVDDKVRRLLRTIERAGAFEHPTLQPERADDRPEHRRLARKAAAEAVVLLKNEGGLLPLNAKKLTSIAVIGPNARWAQIMGGGSSRVTPHYVVAPLDAIRARAGDGVAVDYRIGCANHRMLPRLNPEWVRTRDGAGRGFTVEFFDSPDLSGDPVHTTVTDRTRVNWQKNFVREVTPGSFSARFSGILTVPETGEYTVGTAGPGLSRLLIDGSMVVDNWSDRPADEQPWEAPERTAELHLTAGQPYQLVVECSPRKAFDWAPLQIGCLPTVPPDSIDAAAALAARCDVAVVFAGLTDEWESEGFDRMDMELRGDQVQLIERVAAANPNTVVVLNLGSPVAMEWLDRVPAVLQAWYAGQEAGHAIADVLFGDVNPSGRLPTTFPRRLKDNPAYINYPGENGKVHYGEGLFVGYRYYDKKDIRPLFPFGYGLSYTTFAYRDLTLSATECAPGDEIKVSVTLENTGARAGQEVVQLYLRDVESRLVRPEKELKAFAKVALDPGETRTVTLTLDQEALSYYDPAQEGWVAEPGEFEVLIGRSALDLPLTGRFTLKGAAELNS